MSLEEKIADLTDAVVALTVRMDVEARASETEEKPKRTSRAKSKPKEEPAADDSDDDEQEEKPKRTSRAKSKPKEEPADDDGPSKNTVRKALMSVKADIDRDAALEIIADHVSKKGSKSVDDIPEGKYQDVLDACAAAIDEASDI